MSLFSVSFALSPSAYLWLAESSLKRTMISDATVRPCVTCGTTEGGF